MEHMRATESNLHCSSGRISAIQPDVTDRMRAILVSWLVEVHSKYDLRPETLYITVNMVDRYCEKRRVPRAEYQLLGVTAMFIACKYEEITPPKIAEFVDISDHTYSKQAMLKQEQECTIIIIYYVHTQT